MPMPSTGPSTPPARRWGSSPTCVAAIFPRLEIQGGEGSVLRTLIGVSVIAAVEVVLLLRGFPEELQYLVTGIIVLLVIMLHTIGGRE